MENKEERIRELEMISEIEDLETLVEQFESEDLEKKSEALEKMYIYYGESAQPFYLEALRESEKLALNSLNYLANLNCKGALSTYLVLLRDTKLKTTIKLKLLLNINQRIDQEHFSHVEYLFDHFKLILRDKDSEVVFAVLEFFNKMCKIYYKRKSHSWISDSGLSLSVEIVERLAWLVKKADNKQTRKLANEILNYSGFMSSLHYEDEIKPYSKVKKGGVKDVNYMKILNKTLETGKLEGNFGSMLHDIATIKDPFANEKLTTYVAHCLSSTDRPSYKNPYENAVVALQRLGDINCISQLQNKLDLQNSEIKRKFYRTLRLLKSEKAEQLLLDVLTNEKDSRLKEVAVFSLQSFRGCIFNKVKLLELIQNEENEKILDKLIHIAGTTKDSIFNPYLLKMLEEEQWTVGNLIWALGNIGSRESEAKLIEIVTRSVKKKDISSKIAEQALRSLGFLGGNKSINLLIGLLKSSERLNKHREEKFKGIEDKSFYSLLLSMEPDLARTAFNSLKMIENFDQNETRFLFIFSCAVLFEALGSGLYKIYEEIINNFEKEFLILYPSVLLPLGVTLAPFLFTSFFKYVGNTASRAFLTSMPWLFFFTGIYLEQLWKKEV